MNSAVKGLKDSKGYSADQIIVVVLVNMFDKHLLQGWRQHIHDLNDPPDIIHSQSFLDYQRTIVRDDKCQSSTRLERPPKLKSLPPKKSALKIQENIKNTRKTKCVLCGADHALFLCPEFKEMSVHDRWTKVKFHHLCFICLSKGHSVSSCSSKGHCEKCKSSHHTLLHKELNSTDCSLTLSSTASSEPSTPEPTIGIVHRPIHTFNVPKILMTALALATAGIHERQCRI